MSIDITRPVLQAGSRSLEMLAQKIEECVQRCPAQPGRRGVLILTPRF